MASNIPETAYGVAKRFDFAVEVLSHLSPSSVLDIGCGTGTLLTAPLAERFPGTQFLGIDSDPGTLRFARDAHTLPNLTFSTAEELVPGARFDLVVASEVLEHVEDPLDFLAFVRSHLNPRGRVLMTVPNGFGPFEWMEGLAVVLKLSGAYPLLQTVKRRLLGRGISAEVPAQEANTLAVSPHINFFSYRSLIRTLETSGFAVERYRARTFLCGFVWGAYVITGSRAIAWNAKIADRLPPQAISDWMLVARIAGAPTQTAGYRRSGFEQLRRRLYERRWGIMSPTPATSTTGDG